MFSAVVTFYEVKNWTPDLRTTIHFHRTRDDPPACPNASGHPVAVEVVNFPYSLTIKYMATRLIPSLILDHHAETQLQISALRAAIFYGLSPHTNSARQPFATLAQFRIGNPTVAAAGSGCFAWMHWPAPASQLRLG
jgi:hypothetical protein